MRKTQVQILFVAFLFIAVFFCGVSILVRANDSAEQELFELKRSESMTAKTETLRKQIHKEVSTLGNDHWAGSYYYGDGLGVNVSLDLAPKAGFVFEWRGCMGVYDRNYGTVEEKDGIINLNCELENKREGFQGIDTKLVLIKWGERRYLIGTDQIVDFCNAVNSGDEPRMGCHGFFLLHQDDCDKKVKGFPPVPAKYRPYLLKQPIETEIVKVEKSSLRPSCADWNFRNTVVVLNVGKKDGVLPGMEFHVYEPDDKIESATVKKVNEDSCEAVMTQIGEEDPPPKVGWKLSTAYKWAQERSKECYVIATCGKASRTLVLPITGNETILDAIASVQDLSAISNKDIWIVRSGPRGIGGTQILTADWDLIVRGDISTTDLQLLPGDRVYIMENTTKAFLNYLGRFVNPPPKLTPGINQLTAPVTGKFRESNQYLGYESEL